MKRSVLAIGLVTVVGTIVAAACAFPDVTFSAGDASASETGTPDTGTDGPEDAGFDVAVEAESIDASIGDAQMAIDAASCMVDNCDCDEDGFFDIKKKATCDAGTADAAAYDCDDLVRGRNPGVTTLTPADTPDTGPPPVGDWNCDGKVDLVGKTNLSCKGTLGSCVGSTSDQGAATEGFVGNPGCGQAAPYYKCQAPTLGQCAAILSETKTQGCK